MSLLAAWKKSKDQFEAAVKKLNVKDKSKPSEKGSFLGIQFRKSSGLEEAFKKVDGALEKKEATLLADALQLLNAKAEAYDKLLGTTITDADKAKQEAYAKALKELRTKLEYLVQESEAQQKDLETKGKQLDTKTEGLLTALLKQIVKEREHVKKERATVQPIYEKCEQLLTGPQPKPLVARSVMMQATEAVRKAVTKTQDSHHKFEEAADKLEATAGRTHPLLKQIRTSLVELERAASDLLTYIDSQSEGLAAKIEMAQAQ